MTHTTTQPATTTVVLVGEIHEQHATNPSYTREQLRNILVAARPDAILIELPTNTNLTMAKLARPLLYNTYPSDWAIYSAASEVGAEVVPMDDPDRASTRQAEDRLSAAAGRLYGWAQEHGWTPGRAPATGPNAGLALLLGRMYALYEAASEPADHGTARDANNPSLDAILRTYQGFTYGGIAAQVCRDLGFNKEAEDLSFAAAVWDRRNHHMADTIKTIAAQHPGGRVVAVTGFWHRYALHDLLTGQPGIDLREYYELPGNDPHH